MYAIVLNYKKPLETVLKFRDAHVTYLRKYYERGNFIISGPRNPMDGGFILANAENREEIESIVSEDPFFVENITEVNILEFEPKWFTTGMNQFVTGGNEISPATN